MRTKRTEKTNPIGRPSKKHLKCEVRGCDEPHRSMGLCSSHYQKHRREVRKAEACEEFEWKLNQYMTSRKKEKKMEKDRKSKPNTKWTSEEEHALIRAMDKVDKLPTADGKKREKRDSHYWNDVSTVMRIDSGYCRGAYALEVRHAQMERRKAKENFKEGVKEKPGLPSHWAKVGEEVVQIRSDISQTYEKVTALEHSVSRLEKEMMGMRVSVQNIEKMIGAVCRSYGLPEGGEG
tara:strand:+ start:2681 stop:3385 length:705 start_codon:yes stop_codon:yes gene_type:complete